MSYEKTLSELHYQAQRLKNSIEEYSIKPDANGFYIVQQTRILTAIQEFITASELEYERLKTLAKESAQYHQEEQEIQDKKTEVIIKKLAMLVCISGLQYPTINQSIHTIYEAFLAKQGKIDEVGFPQSLSNIKITLPII